MRNQFMYAVVFAVLCIASLTLPTAAQSYYQRGAEAYNAAAVMEREGKQKEALAAFETMAVNFAKHELADDALRRVAYVSRIIRDFDRAMGAYNQIIEEYPRSEWIPESLYYKGSQLRDAKQWVESAHIYQQLSGYTGNPYMETSLWFVIDGNYNAQNHAGVIAAADAYVANEATAGARRLQALKIKALAQMSLNDEVGLRATMREMMAYPADSYMVGDTYRNIASLYDRGQQLEKAAEYYRKAADYPSTGAAHSDLYYAGYALQRAEKFEDAINLYREYVTLYPRGHYAMNCFYTMAILYRDRLKDRDAELGIYQEVANNYSDLYDMDAWLYRMASTQHATGNTEAAKTTCRLIYERLPGTRYASEGLWLHAEILRGQQDVNGAKSLYQRLVREYDGTRQADSAATRLASM